MALERTVAIAAFDIALGNYKGAEVQWAVEIGGPRELEGDLIKYYIEYKISSTEDHAKKLIKNIKEQARSQAREILGRSEDGRT